MESFLTIDLVCVYIPTEHQRQDVMLFHAFTNFAPQIYDPRIAQFRASSFAPRASRFAMAVDRVTGMHDELRGTHGTIHGQ